MEVESGLKLVHKTGGIFWTTEETGMQHMVKDYENTAKKAGSQAQILTGTDMRRRWPQFNVPSSALGPIVKLIGPVLH